jgi:hypothetical protein
VRQAGNLVPASPPRAPGSDRQRRSRSFPVWSHNGTQMRPASWRGPEPLGSTYADDWDPGDSSAATLRSALWVCRRSGVESTRLLGHGAPVDVASA